MGQYKVPQDVEAEDKLLGPLTARQFIYLIIALAWGGLMWRVFSWNIVIMILVILPVSGFFILLGVGRRQEQSFESYFVAVVRFMLVPRIQVWDKDISTDVLVKPEEKRPELITEKHVTRGSLEQLALIMDTHGSQKDPTIQLQDATNQAMVMSQRVVDPSQIAGVSSQPRTQRVATTDDVLDADSTRSNEVGQLLENIEANIHQQAMNSVRKNLQNTSPSPQNTTSAVSQPQTSDAILKKAMLQGNNLTVQQIAKQANEQILPEGQAINIAPQS